MLKSLKNAKPEKQYTFDDLDKKTEQTEFNFNKEKIEQLESEINELRDQNKISVKISRLSGTLNSLKYLWNPEDLIL